MVEGRVSYAMISQEPKQLYFDSEDGQQYSMITNLTLRSIKERITKVGSFVGNPRPQLMDASAFLDLDSKTLFITIDYFTGIMVSVKCESIELLAG